MTFFAASIVGLLFAYRFTSNQALNFKLRLQASRLSESELNRSYQILENDFYTRSIPSLYAINFKGQVSVMFEEDVSRMIISTVSYLLNGKEHSVSFQKRIVNPSQALGKSTCNFYFSDYEVNSLIEKEVNNLKFSINNIPTDIDAIGNYVFISTDSSNATDTDLYVIDITDIDSPEIISELNTGPGLNNIHVVGDVIFAANSSINGQLQVIDIEDIFHPKLIETIKLPGTYTDNTVIGKKVLYDNNRLYLTTAKSSIDELHIFDTSNLDDPIWKSSYEINAGPNTLYAEHNREKDLIFVASPSDPELLIIDTTDINYPFLSDTFNAPGGLSNGKSLYRYDDLVALGLTVGNKNLYIIDSISGHYEEKLSKTVGTSFNDLIYLSNYLFTITSTNSDFFQIFRVGSTSIDKINNKRFDSTSKVVSMDCDKNSFFFITSVSDRPLIIISPQL